jgi:hypothetical protein
LALFYYAFFFVLWAPFYFASLRPSQLLPGFFRERPLEGLL